MPEARSLLAGSTSPRERAVSEAVAPWWDVPVEILTTLWDPATCPEAALPHLARALRMPLWLDRWNVARKRANLARWIALSRRRGVEATFDELLAMVDVEMVAFRAPPQGLFPTRRWTPAERRAWRARFPEIRVYPFRNAHTRQGGFIPGGCLPMVPMRSVATQFAGRRATIVRDGIETPIPVRVLGGATELATGQFKVSIPTRGPNSCLPMILGVDFIPRRSTAASRVYTYADGPADPDLLLPGRPLDVTPERIRAPHARRHGFFPGDCLPMIPLRSNAAEFIYDSVRIYDPAAAKTNGPPRTGGWILGQSRLRQAPFTIEISIDAKRHRPGGFFPGGILPMTPRPFDRSRIDEADQAMRAAKLGRDQVLRSLVTYRPINAGDGIPADGSFRLGQIIRSL
ncbi:phage tail protein I [Methylobacterium sp. J-090]|uniref:phage tail protein I n=1 Tax=Methylobacterium sp. J-090 TaxID=2836666 RepID=UPI001FBBCB22|nr:phage tail protein I [Methylobacterium sp. J-090]MCJ2080752.1 phage tail protein I [Methylobacterium sp. J-090]